ncbi:MAG: hypothetical protein ACK5QG_16125 [Bacteroidota bacterium]|jgi:hypothetical protein|nr:hypothetical protein [Cytophagales bacterium]
MKGEQELRYESRLLVRPPALPARNTNKGGRGIEVTRTRFDASGNQIKGFFGFLKKAARLETTVIIRNMKIVDSSNQNEGRSRKATDRELYAAAKLMAEEITNSWSTDPNKPVYYRGKLISVKVKFVGQVGILKSFKEARSSDFVINILADGEGRHGGTRAGAGGETRRGSNIMSVDYTGYLSWIVGYNDGEVNERPMSRRYSIVAHEFSPLLVLRVSIGAWLTNKRYALR